MATKKTQVKGPGNIKIKYPQIGTTLRPNHYYRVLQIIYGRTPADHKRKIMSEIFKGSDYKDHIQKVYPRSKTYPDVYYEVYRIPFKPGKHEIP